MLTDFSSLSTAASGQGGFARELAACLTRIEVEEPAIAALESLDIANARQMAEASDSRWREGRPLSPIDGMIIGVKDVIETAAMPTGQGSPMWAGFHSRRDAAAVQALRDAGAIILAKCTTAEFAFTEPLHRTRNPHDLARTPGGSSSGSAAAVAAGFVHVALGTQVVGSTLRPASYCGCYGFKPTFGGLNRSGSYDHLSQSCLGVFGRSLADVEAVTNAIGRSVGGDPGYRAYPRKGERSGARRPNRLAVVLPAGWDHASPGARHAFEQACQRLCAMGIVLATADTSNPVRKIEGLIKDIGPKTFALLDWELRWPLIDYRRNAPDKLSQALTERLARCEESMTLDDYHDLLDWRLRLRQQADQLVEEFDACILLSATGAAPVGLGWTGDPGMNLPASTLGLPAISLPLLQDEGLPLGLQVMGKRGDDVAVFDIARWLVEALG